MGRLYKSKTVSCKTLKKFSFGVETIIKVVSNQIVKFVHFSSIENTTACLERIERLRHIGGRLKPPVDVCVTPDGISTKQQFVRHFRPLRKVLSNDKILALSKQVALFHSVSLVHGDLCMSNIGIQGNKLYIFDWEPAIVMSRGLLRTTSYCVHPEDFAQRDITLQTDRFSVLFLAALSHTGRGDIASQHRAYRPIIVDFLDRFQQLRIDRCTELFLMYLTKKSRTK